MESGAIDSAKAASAPEEAKGSPVLIDLALQGGGAHGVFTWGVLDRLLEVDWLRIDGISAHPLGTNPLKEILSESAGFERIRDIVSQAPR